MQHVAADQIGMGPIDRAPVSCNLSHDNVEDVAWENIASRLLHAPMLDLKNLTLEAPVEW